MSDYTKSKKGFGELIPENEVSSAWDRTEPLVTPEVVRTRHLFGIPLVSNIVNPITKKLDVITDDIIKDLIAGAVSDLEIELGIHIFPSQKRERHSFDYNEFQSFGYFKLRQRPCASIESLKIESSDGISFFDVPLEWIETGNLHQGQINILPLSPGTFGSMSIMTGGPGALVFMSALQARGNIPAYWTAEYTAGFPDGMLPRVINDLIGIQTSMNVLSMLSATYARSNSTSLGIDGMSQSVSTPGPNLWTARTQDLNTKKEKLVSRIKTMFGLKMFSGTI